MEQSSNFTGSTMKALRDMKDRNRHTRAAYQFLSDLKAAKQVDLDEFGDQKITKFMIPNNSGTSIEIKFFRNEVEVYVNLVAKREKVYSITHKSWDSEDNELDNPSDGWKFSKKAAPEPEPVPAAKGSERSRRTIDPGDEISIQVENMNPKWILAMKELIYGSR